MNINKINCDYNKNQKPSFSALKKIKCAGLFNPRKNKDDFSAYCSLFLSDAFKYLFENRDVKVVFDKFYREDENRIYSVLRYSFLPIEKKSNVLKKIMHNIKYSIIPNSKEKHHWLEAVYDKKTGEKITLREKISSVKLDQIKKYMKN